MTPEQIADIRARFTASAGTSDDTLAIVALFGEVERLQTLVAKIQVQVDYWFATDELTHADGIMENIAYYLEGRDLPGAAPASVTSSDACGMTPVTPAMLDFRRYGYRIGLPEVGEEWLGGAGQWYAEGVMCHDDTLIRYKRETP